MRASTTRLRHCVSLWIVLNALCLPALAQPLPAEPGATRCKEVTDVLAPSHEADADTRRKLRLEAEQAIPAVANPLYAASCYAAIARAAAEDGDYDAERLYLRAAVLAPDDPDILEAVARYYRVYRGSHGLFAESEAFYVRAEQAALERESATSGSESAGADDTVALESIRRGRIDLVRDEGLGLRIPKGPDEQLGIYAASLFDYGRFTLPQGELVRISTQPQPTPMPMATLPPPPIGGPSPPPVPTVPTVNADANARTAVQDRNHLDLLERVRLRYGKLPYLDVTWARSREDSSAPLMPSPPPTPAPGMQPPAPPALALDDSTRTNVGAAIEDQVAFAPLGDLLWRIEYTHERRKPDSTDANSSDRATASATWTRSLGRFKTDFSAVAGSSFDGEYIAGGSIHTTQFLDAALEPNPVWSWEPGAFGSAHRLPLSPPPRPPSNDYMLGYQREEMTTPDGDKVINHIAQVGAHFLDALPARTDLATNAFFNMQHPQRVGPDSGNVELHVDLLNRLIDRLLEPDTPRTDRRLATNRASLSLGYLEDLAVRGPDRFESRGMNAGVRLETFSAPLNFGTVVVELSYQLRDYYHIGEVRHVPWVSVRAGLGGP